MADTTELVPELLEAGVHFGHQTKRWNPKMRPYIFEQKNQIYIINLDETVRQLQRATQFLEEITRRGEANARGWSTVFRLGPSDDQSFWTTPPRFRLRKSIPLGLGSQPPVRRRNRPQESRKQDALA